MRMKGETPKMWVIEQYDGELGVNVALASSQEDADRYCEEMNKQVNSFYTYFNYVYTPLPMVPQLLCFEFLFDLETGICTESTNYTHTNLDIYPELLGSELSCVGAGFTYEECEREASKQFNKFMLGLSGP